MWRSVVRVSARTAGLTAAANRATAETRPETSSVSEGNGCAHVRQTEHREGNDSVMRCNSCGAETSRVEDFYDDDE